MPKQTEVAQNYTITVDRVPEQLDLLTGHADSKSKKRSVMLLSAPGIGKTEGVTAFAESIKAKLITLVASTLDRMDVAGLPITVTDDKLGLVTRFAPMEMMAQLCRKLNAAGEPVVLYFNELMDAPESVYPVLMRLFNERAIGDIQLRDNVVLIADGNPPEVNVSGRSLPFAMRRRFEWLVIRPDVNIWMNWALNAGVDARVVSFFSVGDFKQHFCQYDPQKMRHAITYPNPASWTKLGERLAAVIARYGTDARDSDKAAMRAATFAAFVGTEAATAFCAYLNHMNDIPDVEGILKNPEEAKLPKEPSMLGLLVGSAVQHAVENPKLVDNVVRLANRMLDSGKGEDSFPEYGAFLIRACAAVPNLRGKISSTPAMKKTLKLVMEIPELLAALQAANAAVARG